MVFWERELVAGNLRYIATGAATAMFLTSLVPRHSFLVWHDYLQTASMLGFLWYSYKTKTADQRVVHTLAVICTAILKLLELMEVFVVTAHFPPSVNLAIGRIAPFFEYVAVYGVMVCVFKRSEFLVRGYSKAYPASSVTRLRPVSPHLLNNATPSRGNSNGAPAPPSNTARGRTPTKRKETPPAAAAAPSVSTGRSQTPGKKAGRPASPPPKTPKSGGGRGRRTSSGGDTPTAKSPAARGRGSSSGRKRSRSRS